MTTTMNSALRKVIRRKDYPREVILICVRWYAANQLSLLHVV
jgi:transposase-like protein